MQTQGGHCEGASPCGILDTCEKGYAPRRLLKERPGPQDPPSLQDAKSPPARESSGSGEVLLQAQAGSWLPSRMLSGNSAGWGPAIHLKAPRILSQSAPCAAPALHSPAHLAH